jgi:hypothetical protein
MRTGIAIALALGVTAAVGGAVYFFTRRTAVATQTAALTQPQAPKAGPLTALGLATNIVSQAPGLANAATQLVNTFASGGVSGLDETGGTSTDQGAADAAGASDDDDGSTTAADAANMTEMPSDDGD